MPKDPIKLSPKGMEIFQQEMYIRKLSREFQYLDDKIQNIILPTMIVVIFLFTVGVIITKMFFL